MRLDRLLYNTGFGSKRNVTQLFNRRQIYIDGRLATHLGQNVDPFLQAVCVSGQRITGDKQHVYYMLNKPQGVVTANSDRKLPTVIDLIAPEDRRPALYAVGRLDGDTEGLLLLTDNGPLGYRLLHPQRHIPKTYAVTTLEPLETRDIERFHQGIIFHDGTQCKSAQLHIISPHHAHVTLHEGKFHQVKKMFLSVGKKITHLKRITFGDLALDSTLNAGEYRPLTSTELAIIKQYLD
ncbi:16S rRNA pseudouridine(516) synthase [Aerococcaceae bacterium NML180378]|nr:16S rRNA pseudouridine(516) synthase [Aerococcaceae bacterium NML180378]